MISALGTVHCCRFAFPPTVLPAAAVGVRVAAASRDVSPGPLPGDPRDEVSTTCDSVPYAYPAAVFPTVAALIDSEIFKSAVYEEAVNEFVELLRAASLAAVCTTKKRFIAFLIVFILANALTPTYGFAEPNLVFFEAKMRPLVDGAFVQYVNPLLRRMDAH
jgi:hypothetical protein